MPEPPPVMRIVLPLVFICRSPGRCRQLLWENAQHGAELQGKRGGPQFAIQENVIGTAGGEEPRGFAIFGDGPHFVSERDGAMVGAGDDGGDFDFIVITRGAEIAAIDFGDGEENAVVALEIFVAEAVGAAVIDAGDFHPDEVVGVIDDAHLIGFRIADANAGGDGGHGVESS